MNSVGADPCVRPFLSGSGHEAGLSPATPTTAVQKLVLLK